MDAQRIEQLEAMLKMDPSNPVLHYTLGIAFHKNKDYRKAIAALSESLRLKPDYSAAYRELGKAQSEIGRLAAARVTYEKGIAVAEQAGDIQTAKEMRVFMKRLEKQNP